MTRSLARSSLVLASALSIPCALVPGASSAQSITWSATARTVAAARIPQGLIQPTRRPTAPPPAAPPATSAPAASAPSAPSAPSAAPSATPAPAPAAPAAPSTAVLSVPGFQPVQVSASPASVPACTANFAASAQPGAQCRTAAGAIVTRLARSGDSAAYFHLAAASGATVWTGTLTASADAWSPALRARQSDAAAVCSARGGRLPSRTDYEAAAASGMFASLPNVSGAAQSISWTSTLRGDAFGTALASAFIVADPRLGGGANRAFDAASDQRYEVRCVF